MCPPGSPPLTSECRPPPFDGSALSLIAWLRWADTRVPVSAGLGVAGTTLLLLGVAWGACAVFAAHPWVASLCAGATCLLAAAMAHQGGLVSLLPIELKDLLLRTTPFDFLFDDSGVTNLVRRWGRLLLLCGQRTEGEIQTILRGLDYEFLDTVLRRGMVHMLPAGLRLLLLPNLQQPAHVVVTQGRPSMQRLQWWVGGLGSLMAKYTNGSCKSHGEVHRIDLTPSGIHKLLCQKTEETRSKIVEPALGPVVCQLAVHQSLQLAALASMASAGAWISSALFFCTPSARSTLRMMASPSSRDRTSQVAQAATGFSLLFAGTSLAFAFCIQRRWLPASKQQLFAADVSSPAAAEGALRGGRT